jgi:hypothetical protein
MAAGVRGNANIMKAITWARAIVARGPSMRDTARILARSKPDGRVVSEQATGGAWRMRWRSIILDLALMVAVWTIVLRLLHQRRARMAVDASPHAVLGYRVHTAAAIAAMVGVTWFSVWLITDTIGPHWLHSLSLLAALLFITIGGVLAGYAGWVGGP